MELSRLSRMLLIVLLSSALWAQGNTQGKTQTNSSNRVPGAAPSKRQANADKTLDGCICGVDEAMAAVKIVPWNQEKKAWTPEDTRVFVFQDKTIIKGESSSTVAELKNGKAVKTAHFEGISIDGGVGRVHGTPFEITRLSECVGRRTTLYWVADKGTPVAERITLPYLFSGESMAGYIGGGGGRSVDNGGRDNCPCKLN